MAASNKPRNRIPAALRAQVLARDGFRCVYCGACGRMSIDHVIPRAKRGPTAPENLVACCLPCNRKKSDWPVHLFAMRLEAEGHGAAVQTLARLFNSLHPA
jgi:5-methylcytosine-specific restriction endonuclease McrA